MLCSIALEFCFYFIIFIFFYLDLFFILFYFYYYYFFILCSSFFIYVPASRMLVNTVYFKPFYCGLINKQNNVYRFNNVLCTLNM